MNIYISAENIRKYRSFALVLHVEYGFLLLESNKLKKGEQYQFPGGRLDISDFNIINESLKKSNLPSTNPINIEEIVFKSCAARELYEETGLDYRRKLDKFERLNFNYSDKFNFFLLKISNQDNLLLDTYSNDNYKWDWNLINTIYNNCYIKVYNYIFLMMGVLTKCSGDIEFYLKLSNEHKSFLFENKYEEIPVMIKNHSKGICSKAFECYLSYINNNKDELRSTTIARTNRSTGKEIR
ncbi:hypothetical protein RS030_3403 [Cryptosporidium xiaoi]|uniref:Nudix hydrolase domain-containing protein n=1 Tax=Cryptosporidium xiaoi TaxID=659607 RepID=A0AAV9Y1W0_9CRYT